MSKFFYQSICFAVKDNILYDLLVLGDSNDIDEINYVFAIDVGPNE